MYAIGQVVPEPTDELNKVLPEQAQTLPAWKKQVLRGLISKLAGGTPEFPGSMNKIAAMQKTALTVRQQNPDMPLAPPKTPVRALLQPGQNPGMLSGDPRFWQWANEGKTPDQQHFQAIGIRLGILPTPERKPPSGKQTGRNGRQLRARRGAANRA